MIKLEENDYKLIKRLEEKNSKNYRLLEVDEEYYIRYYDLICCLDDTSDNRDYAEQKLIDVVEEYESKKDDNIPGLEKSLQNEVNRLKKENEELKEENEILRNNALFYCNEDDLDRLAFEGVEL